MALVPGAGAGSAVAAATSCSKRAASSADRVAVSSAAVMRRPARPPVWTYWSSMVLADHLRGLPRVGDGGGLRAAGTVQGARLPDRGVGEGAEAAVGADAGVAQGVVPDPPRHLPGVAAEGGGGEVEGV